MAKKGKDKYDAFGYNQYYSNLFGRVDYIKSQKNNSRVTYNELYDYYFEMLEMYATNIFQYEVEGGTLPLTFNTRYLEKGLFNTGMMYVGALNYESMKDEIYTLNILYGSTAEKTFKTNNSYYKEYQKLIKENRIFDIYGDLNLEIVKVIGETYIAYDIIPSKGVIVYDNNSRESLRPKISLFAKLLTEIHLVITQNVNQQANPYIIVVNKESLLSMKNIAKQIEDNDPYIFIDNTIGVDNAIKVNELSVEFKANEMHKYLLDVWKWALNMIGINSGNEKRERMIQSEVALDNQEYFYSLNDRLLERQKMCDKLNEIFNLGISVKIASNLDNRLSIGDLPLDIMNDEGKESEIDE